MPTPLWFYCREYYLTQIQEFLSNSQKINILMKVDIWSHLGVSLK